MARGGFNPYPKPIFRDHESIDPSRVHLERRMNLTDVAVFNPGHDIKHPDEFCLQIRKSRIEHPESGYGVFVQGTILPGTVVALYPGVVYWPQACLVT